MFPFTARIGFGRGMTPVMFWRTSREYVRCSVVIVAPSRYRSDATASPAGTESTNRIAGLPLLYSAGVTVYENTWFATEFTVTRVFHVAGGVRTCTVMSSPAGSASTASAQASHTCTPAPSPQTSCPELVDLGALLPSSARTPAT